ncbi:MAG: DUF2178 domain-containing protein [Methanomicrobium sp.]|nr:DUF2178 domain-containing protein [Methanomicrobium sp.]
MRRNTYYIAVSLTGIVVALIFWGAVIYARPPAMEAVTLSVIAAAVGIYFLRQKIDDTVITDEMISRINEKSALRSLQIFWVGFLAFTISGFSMAMSVDNPRFQEMIIRGVCLPADIPCINSSYLCRIQDVLLTKIRRIRGR